MLEAAGLIVTRRSGRENLHFIEADAPHRLVQTWRMNMDPEMVAEGYTRLTYEIKEVQPGVTRLTVTHDLESAPKLAVLMRGGLEDTGAAGGAGAGRSAI